MLEPPPASRTQILRRGLSRRCPRCGVGKLFDGWMQVREKCDHCGLVLEPLEGNSWWFMYYTTGGFTGLIIVVMLLFKPANIWLGRIAVLTFALLFIVVTLPYRKGLALAIDYLSERGDEEPPTSPVE